jgi:hypothetical protein
LAERRDGKEERERDADILVARWEEERGKTARCIPIGREKGM